MPLGQFQDIPQERAGVYERYLRVNERIIDEVPVGKFAEPTIIFMGSIV